MINPLLRHGDLSLCGRWQERTSYHLFMSPEPRQQHSGGCVSFFQAGEEPLLRKPLQQEREEPGCQHWCSAWVLPQSWLLLPRIYKGIGEGRRILEAPCSSGENPRVETALDADGKTPTPASLLQIIWQGDQQPSQSCNNSIRAVLAPISKAFSIMVGSRLTGKGPLGPPRGQAQQTNLPCLLWKAEKPQSHKLCSLGVWQDGPCTSTAVVGSKP